jgi:hypothetical protein
MRFPHSHSLDDDPFVALHTINERSPSHHLIPLGSSFDEKMLQVRLIVRKGVVHSSDLLELSSYQ